MTDIIHLLPDSVANQIAAGEVIQRPSSVVKELIENSIDAGCRSVTINIKDAGRTLIQVIDDGKGMSPSDARMSFERHATSKIKEAIDLFAIRTMGFRGEALASIASVAEVELKTRQHDEELGTYLHMMSSVLIKQSADHFPAGTNIAVKNLFYNVPARRKFLKSNSYELKNIITEIQRIALANPQLAISLYHNQSAIYELTPENIRKRIISLFGKGINQSLIPVEVDTTLIQISGFIGQPKFAKKSFGEQFFFVNGRFMKHPFFHRAVTNAYERILPPDSVPSYFLYFEVDPATIDINIHPTKTEIKFEDEQAAWHMINAAIRESIGKFNLMPAIDFDQAGAIDIPLPLQKGSNILSPEIRINPDYNPFKEDNYRENSWDTDIRRDQNLSHWQNLYPDKEEFRHVNSGFISKESNYNDEEETGQQSFPVDDQQIISSTHFLQFKNKYILTPVKSGLLVIDQKEAHTRILYDNFLSNLKNHQSVSQKQLFPTEIELNAADAEMLLALRSELHKFGFEISQQSDQLFLIEGVPGALSHLDPKDLIEKAIETFSIRPADLVDEICEQLALLLAQSSSVTYGTTLQQEEMSNLFNQLFACQMHTFSPSGKKIISIISLTDFEKLLKE